jgi:hypothetical protein
MSKLLILKVEKLTFVPDQQVVGSRRQSPEENITNSWWQSVEINLKEKAQCQK